MNNVVAGYHFTGPTVLCHTVSHVLPKNVLKYLVIIIFVFANLVKSFKKAPVPILQLNVIFIMSH